MDGVLSKQVWIKIDSTGMWSPSERRGWWIIFALTTRELTEAYGPFAVKKEALAYLRWALEEAELNKNNEPAIVAALHATEEVAFVET